MNPGRISAVVRKFAGRIRRYFFHTIVRDAGSGASFGLIGSQGDRHHFARLYLGERDGQVTRMRPQVANLAHVARRLARQYGLAVLSEVRVPAALAREVLRVPAWIGMSLEIPATFEAFVAGLSTSAKSDVAKVRRGGFAAEICTDATWIPEFQRRFHAAAMTSRHGAEGVVLTSEQLANEMRDAGAEFIRIVRDGEWVAGALTRAEAGAYRLRRLGWRDGDMELHRAGVLPAVYLFSIRRASELGVRRVRFGGTPPYLEDGVTFFKAKWGASYDPAETWYGERALRIDPAHPHCQRFFSRRALVAFGTERALVVFSGMRPDEIKIPGNGFRNISRWYRLRATPEEPAAETRAEVPAHLRPWFVEETVPAV